MAEETLRSLLQSPDATVEHAALVVARDAYPGLDVGAELARLDELAVPLARRLAVAKSLLASAGALGTYVYDQLGFRGDEESYYDPRNSYLNEVLARRTGIPISLAVLLIALGRRAGVLVEGVSFPGHFLVRLGGEGGPYLDPFFRARVLSPEGLSLLARRSMGANAKVLPEHLRPVSPTLLVVRMLTNLKAIYESRREHARALVVCDRLVDLTGAPEQRRDRGVHALALGAVAAGTDDLEAYLASRPDAPDAERLRALLVGASPRARAMN